MPGARSFVTLLNSENYLGGVLGLCQALCENGSLYPITVCATPEISPQSIARMKAAGAQIAPINPVTLPSTIDGKNIGRPHWTKCFDKLHMFGLVQFEKCVYVDGDMLLAENVDHLFECADMAGAIAGKHFPGNETWTGLNAGLLVFEPSRERHEMLIDRVPSVVARLQDVGDQDVIQECFGWPTSSAQILDERYNTLAPYMDYYVNHVYKSEPASTIKVVHFIGAKKPWQRGIFSQVRHQFYLLRNGRVIEAAYTRRYERLLRRAEKSAGRVAAA